MIQKPDVTIRRASLGDAGLLAELGARTFSETFAADNTPEDMAAYLASSFTHARQAAELADDASTFFVAEVGGIAAGYAKLRAGEPEEGIEGAKPVELVRLYVSREWLGRGVGQALMRACMEGARMAGHETIWLGVWERNGRARAFYSKWGFRAVGEHVFQLGSDPQTDILMERAV
ncbi:MAG: GNAT family N-acetyltransferase [Acidobacteriota bacterium]|nr:GNAT family N-acetyltransferase [Acidobacteriota bacterium]